MKTTAGRKRIGIIGFGYVGASLYRRITSEIATDGRATDGRGPFEVAFVHARRPEALADVDPVHALGSLEAIADRAPDIIVEAAHPDITRSHGAHFLRHADYMPLSITALADDKLRAELETVARDHGTRLLLPHGALVGLESLIAWRDMWDDVAITFRKPPNSIDFDKIDLKAQDITVPTVVFDGPVRMIARLFPRNVNAMVALALATIGLDRTRARLVADPAAKKLELLIEARGRDGAELRVTRLQPAVGVSGSEMFESLYRSLLVASGLFHSRDFV